MINNITSATSHIAYIKAEYFQTAALSRKGNKSRSHPKCIIIRDQLIPTLRGQNPSRDNDRASAENSEAPADDTENPRLIEVPAHEEPIFVIVEVCLAQTISTNPLPACVVEPTTIDMLAACRNADITISRLSNLHPFSRSRFPPMRITMYVTMLMPCSTTANDIRNPTERHIEQKYRSSPWQSSR